MPAVPDAIVAPLEFTTDAWPEDQRFAAWSSHNRGSVFTQTGEGIFAARARVWIFDGIILSEHWTDAFRGVRDARLARSIPLDHVMLIMPFDGTTRVRGAGVNVACGPGDIAVLDYRRPLSTENSRQHGIAVSIQRDMLESRCGPVDLHGRMEDTAEARFLLGYVRNLVLHLDGARRSSLGVITNILRDIIAMAVSSGGAGPIPGREARPDLKSRICAYIAETPHGALTIDAIVRALPITRSTLQRMFSAQGGVIAYDRKRRLALVHRTVCGGDRRTLTEIGAAFGFADAANLARLFHAHYGYSMSELRKGLAPASLTGAAAGSIVDTYQAAITAMSRR